MRKKGMTPEMTQKSIADALIRLLAEKEYSEITVAEIADTAGINRSTYYRNFSSKEDVVRCYYGCIMQKCLAEFETSGTKTNHMYLLTMFRAFHFHREGLALCDRARLTPLMLDALNAHILPNGIGGRGSDVFPTAYYVGGICNFLAVWISRGMGEAPEEIVRICETLLPDSSQRRLSEAFRSVHGRPIHFIARGE